MNTIIIDGQTYRLMKRPRTIYTYDDIVFHTQAVVTAWNGTLWVDGSKGEGTLAKVKITYSDDSVLLFTLPHMLHYKIKGSELRRTAYIAVWRKHPTMPGREIKTLYPIKQG